MVRLAALLVVAVVAALCVPAVLPGVLPGVRARLPWFPAAACARTTVVEVVATPAVAPVIDRVTRDLEGHRMPDDSCLSVRTRAQDTVDTIASSAVLPASQAPQLWISDSSLWTSQIKGWKVTPAGSLASSPVLMVSSSRAVEVAGWTTKRPTWVELFGGAKNLSIPGLADEATGELALIALWQSAGRGAVADRAVVAAQFAAKRSPYTTQDDALSAIVKPATDRPDDQAPFVVTTEQAVVEVDRDSTRSVLTPVYPADGSPYLDFPVVRVADAQQDAAHRAGTDLVVDTLATPQARAALHDIGLRDPNGGNPPAGKLGLPATVARATAPPAADLARFDARWKALSAPSRILTVIDASTSMRTVLPGLGLSRLQLAGRAASAVGDLLPDTSSAGLWAFSLNQDHGKPYSVLSNVARLGSPDGGETHRKVLQKQLLGVDQVPAGPGTGLYVTALDAVRAVRASYDETATNSVVLFTDGSNQNDPTLTLTQLVSALRKDAQDAPGRPVRLVCIGLGPDVDMRPLRTMAAAAGGGGAFQAARPADLQGVLYDAVASRS